MRIGANIYSSYPKLWGSKTSGTIKHMKKLPKNLKVHIRNSPEKTATDAANLLGFFALLYQVDMQNKKEAKNIPENQDKNLKK